MSKSWETLFHLSSFMKYLLYEVLPNENTNCPQYLLDSLFELLNITLKCIQFIKYKHPSGSEQESNHSVAENHAIQAVAGYREKTENPITSRDIRPNEHLHNNHKKSSNERIKDPGLHPENKIPHNTKMKVNELALRINSAESQRGLVKHQSIILKKNFLFLNEQVMSGCEKFGSYCLLCDKCFFTPNDWEEHVNYDTQHLGLPNKASCQDTYCEKCNFVVYGNIALADVYLDYHVKAHKGNSKKDNPEPIFHSDVKDVNYSKKYNSQGVFYCGGCNENFPSAVTWQRHISEIHPELGGGVNYNITKKTNKSLRNNSNLQEVQNMSQSDDKLSTSSRLSYDQQNDVTSNRRKLTEGEAKKKGDYMICKKFIDLNNMIHKDKRTGMYYCRPCDTVCSLPENWIDHCRNEKHTSYMNDINFKNIKVVCDYCSLTFLGSDRPVKEYMRYHTDGHGKVPSYVVNYIHETEDKPKKKTRRKKQQPYNEESVEEQHYNNEHPSMNECPEPSSVPSSRSSTSSSHLGNEKISNSRGEDSESNWYASSRDEEIKNNVKEMLLIRKKEKLSGKVSSFGGYCLICEVFICDAFDWMDHLNANEHCSRIKEGDEDIEFHEFNLNVFGNKIFIQNIRQKN